MAPHRKFAFTFLLAGVTSAPLARAEAPSLHVGAGAAHAVSGPQERELGLGGAGLASVEARLTRVVGLQAAAGALVLSKGDPPADPTLAPRSTGVALFGAVGVRIRPLGARSSFGPWLDANAGVAGTGGLARPVADGHVGWDFPVGASDRFGLGPFVGYTQIIEGEKSLRPEDARIVSAGLTLSFDTRRVSPPPPPPVIEAPPPPAVDADGATSAYSTCPGEPPEADVSEEGCGRTEIRVVQDRIVLDDVIHFEFDSPRVHPGSRGLVGRVAQFLRETPEIVEVSIEGHADAVGTDAYNQRLSEARAASIRDLLVEFGTPRERLRLVGHGKSHLKVATDRREEKNRRVEFMVTRTRTETSKAPPGSRAGGEP